MRTIGLIGGTTWGSTMDYYRVINQTVNEKLGGMNSARLLLYSVNFEDFKPGPSTDWQEMGTRVAHIAGTLEKAGADCILLCANTLHMMADIVQSHIGIPLIHIAVETSREIRQRHFTKVGLLGTRFTMEQPFFREQLTKQGIETLIPDAGERDYIHTSIFEELGRQIFRQETRKGYLDIIDRLVEQGAEGIIFGCTEIPLLIKEEECPVPVFDTTVIHAKAGVRFALAEQAV